MDYSTSSNVRTSQFDMNAHFNHKSKCILYDFQELLSQPQNIRHTASSYIAENKYGSNSRCGVVNQKS